MNNETLVKDLCRRMPYGVKGQLIHDLRDEFEDEEFVTDIEIFNKGSVWTYKGYSDVCLPMGEGDFHGFLIQYNGQEYTCVGNSVKPILFPSLTEPITINGQTFVPIVEILKIQHVDWWKDKEGTRYGEIEFSETPNSAKACFSFMATKGITLYTLMPWNYPLWIIEKLNEWHINYRLSPNQFVAVTENNNPYL